MTTPIATDLPHSRRHDERVEIGVANFCVGFRMTLVLHWRALALIVSALIASSALADEDVAACAARKVAFDGIEPLTYEKVIGESNAHVALLKQHPAMCKEAENEKCRGKAYLVPGDVVAVAKSCGEYAHVQFIGEKNVSYGWLARKSLERMTPGRVDEPPHQIDDGERLFHFTLSKGRGVPVCEAYLQRLNMTDSTKREGSLPAPYCGRSETDVVYGFQRLTRVQLEAKRANQMFLEIFNLTHPSTPLQKSGNEHVFGSDEAALTIWRYVPQVDIDNDGTPDDVLIWQGFGADTGTGGCGAEFGHGENGPLIADPWQIAYALAPGGDLDVAKTQQIFGHPSGGYEYQVDGRRMFVKGFKPIGHSMSIFKYRNSYYFDAMFDWWGDLEGKHGNAQNTFGVFLRKSGRTAELCEAVMHTTESYPRISFD